LPVAPIDNNDLAFLSSSPAPLLELLPLVAQSIADLPPDTWHPTLPYTSNEQQSDPVYISRCLFDVLQRIAPAAIAAVYHRHQRDEWPTLSPPQVYYLRLMHGRLKEFSQGIVLSGREGAETVFPFPKANIGGASKEAPPKDVLLWFLTEWWIEHGLQDFIFEVSHRPSGSSPFEFSKN